MNLVALQGAVGENVGECVFEHRHVVFFTEPLEQIGVAPTAEGTMDLDQDRNRARGQEASACSYMNKDRTRVEP